MASHQVRQLLTSLALILPLLSISVLSQGACRPPSIIEEGRRALYYPMDGYIIQIPCEASGNGPLTYQWTKNGETLDTSSLMEQGSGTLVFNDPGPQDEGLYQCHVSNACGTSMSVATQMVFGRLEPFPMIGTPRVITAHVGEDVVLRCIPPRSTPEPEMAWIILADNYQYQIIDSDDRITMDDWGNLHITNVQLDDERSGHTYVCLVSNSLLRRYVMGEDTQITVLDSSGPRGQRPASLIWASHSHMVVLQGDEIKMKCIFAGDPVPTTSWEKVGGQFDESRTEVSHHELYMYDAQLSDSGVYTCSGQNSANQNAVVRSFNVTVESAPEWQSEPTDITVGVGESAEFECLATGIPEPNVQWFINGQPIQDLPVDPRRTLVENSLHFSNLDLTDSQVIQCNASNTHGYAWADVYLYVEE